MPSNPSLASGVTTVEDCAYNALGALKVNAGVVQDDQRPKLAGGGTADAAARRTRNFVAGDLFDGFDHPLCIARRASQRFLLLRD